MPRHPLCRWWVQPESNRRRALTATRHPLEPMSRQVGSVPAGHTKKEGLENGAAGYTPAISTIRISQWLRKGL